MRKLIIYFSMMSALVSTVHAQSQSELSVDIVVNADYGWPTNILISGYSHLDIAWLGISLYPYGTLDVQAGGRHSHIELENGHLSHEIQVDQPLLGGSFEVALWSEKVDKVDCTLDYCYWCKVNGFHFSELLVYKSGLLNVMKGYED